VWCEAWDKVFDPHNTLTLLLLLLMAASVVRWEDKVQRTGRLMNVGYKPQHRLRPCLHFSRIGKNLMLSFGG
jgi:hypothetical protein